MTAPIEESRPGYVWTGDRFVLFSGPPGVAGVTPHFGLPLQTTTDLPPLGSEGEMRFIENTGDVWGWDQALGKWAVAGQWRGKQGKAGPPGETLKVNGIVGNYAALNPQVAELSVYVTQDSVHMYVKDSASAVADANGWVDMGQVQGPPGPAAMLTGTLPTVADLPALGDPGQMLLVEENGHLYGWSQIDQKWNDGGWIRRPAALITQWSPITYAENAVVLHNNELWVAAQTAHAADTPGAVAGTPVAGTTVVADKAGDLGHEGTTPLSPKVIETYDFAAEGKNVKVGGFLRFTVTAPATLPYTPNAGSFTGVPFTEATSWIINTGDPTVGHDGWIVVPASQTAGETTHAWSEQRGLVWELAAVTKLADLTDVTITTPKAHETLTYDGTAWVNAPAASGVPFGTIIATLLSETAFLANLPPDQKNDWVLCDGRAMPADSKWAKAYGAAWTPALGGSFLRGAGKYGTWDGGALGTYHDDTTRMPRNPFVTATAGNHKHALDNSRLGIDEASSGYLTVGGTPMGGYVWGEGMNILQAAGDHQHTVAGGDAETVPKHVVVNYFVKVT